MKSARWLLCAFIFLGAAAPAGKWVAFKTWDKFEDKQKCSVTNNLGASIAENGLLISMPSPPQSIEWRLDDGPIESGNVLSSVSAVYFNDLDLDRIKKARRLRLRVLVYNNVVTRDYSLVGLEAALKLCSQKVAEKTKEDQPPLEGSVRESLIDSAVKRAKERGAP